MQYQRTTMAVMPDPKLSEFSEYQLRIMLHACTMQRLRTEAHIAALRENEVYEELFKDRIFEYQHEVKETLQCETQLAGQLAMAIKQTQIANS